MQNGSTATMTEQVPGQDNASPMPIDTAAAKEKLEMARAKVTEFVEEHPVAAVAGAVAAGFLVGRLLSRI